MKVRKYTILLLIYLIFVQILFVSCIDKDKDQEVKEPTKSVELEKGTYIDTTNDGNYIYYLDHNKIHEGDEIITNYNTKVKSYVFFRDGKYYVSYNGEDKVIDHNKIYHQALSPNGKKLLYLVKEEYISPRVYDLEKGKEMEINNTAIISGEFIDWFTDDKLAYYGVDDEKKAGIYTYDINTGDENLVYKIEEGFVQYFKYVGNGITFIKQYIDGNTMLKLIDTEGKVVDISEEVKEIYDVIVNDNNIFFIGRMKDNTYSLYRVDDSSIKRLVFDFPENLVIEKGLSQDSEGNILFIGSNNSGENIYKYDKNSEISILTSKSGNYNFIKIN